MTDQEIMAKLQERSTPELLRFRAKLKKMNTTEALAVRFFILKILTFRYVFGEDLT